MDRESLDRTLATQYQVLENQRRPIREELISLIEEGFNYLQPDKRVQALFDAFKNTVTEGSEEVRSDDERALVVVARAIHELIGAGIENAEAIDFARAFIDLVAAASDRDEGDTDGDEAGTIRRIRSRFNNLVSRQGKVTWKKFNPQNYK